MMPVTGCSGDEVREENIKIPPETMDERTRFMECFNDLSRRYP